MPKKQRIYDYFSEFASEALHIVIFEIFIKSMTSCLSKLKVTPCFCFPLKSLTTRPQLICTYISGIILNFKIVCSTIFFRILVHFFWVLLSWSVGKIHCTVCRDCLKNVLFMSEFLESIESQRGNTFSYEWWMPMFQR